MNRLGRRRIYNKDNTYLQDIREGSINMNEKSNYRKYPEMLGMTNIIIDNWNNSVDRVKSRMYSVKEQMRDLEDQ